MKPFEGFDQAQGRYEMYLHTEIWRRKASARAEIDGNKCAMCGSRGTERNPLQCHHLSYRNLYHEDVEKDLVTLCKACHYGVHEMMCRITNQETGQRGWKDKLPYSVHVSNFSEDGQREELFKAQRKEGTHG